MKIKEISIHRLHLNQFLSKYKGLNLSNLLRGYICKGELNAVLYRDHDLHFYSSENIKHLNLFALAKFLSNQLIRCLPH